MSEVRIHELKKVNLAGGTVIEGFPSVGLAGTISASCLISTLNLKQIAVLDSELFPPLSIVFRGQARNPARIYADEKAKIAIAVGEFTPEPPAERVLADTIFSWSRANKISLIVTSMGLFSESADFEEQEALGVGTTDKARKRLEKAGIRQLGAGAVAGLPAVLLNRGLLEKVDVIALLAKVHKDIPDYRAGVKIAQAIDKLVPGAKCDIKPLLAEAERIEGELRTIRTQSKPTTPQMYR